MGGVGIALDWVHHGVGDSIELGAAWWWGSDGEVGIIQQTSGFIMSKLFVLSSEEKTMSTSKPKLPSC